LSGAGEKIVADSCCGYNMALSTKGPAGGQKSRGSDETADHAARLRFVAAVTIAGAIGTIGHHHADAMMASLCRGNASHAAGQNSQQG